MAQRQRRGLKPLLGVESVNSLVGWSRQMYFNLSCTPKAAFRPRCVDCAALYQKLPLGPDVLIVCSVIVFRLTCS